MSTPEDRQIATLFRASTATLEPDVAELVARGIARGRASRRRRRAVTVVAAVAVLGVVGVGAGLAAGQGDTAVEGRVADAPSDQRTKKAPPEQRKGAPGTDAELAVPAVDVPGTFERLLPDGEAGPPLRESGYTVVDEPDMRLVFFRWNGALSTFIIEQASSMPTCSQQARQSGPRASCDRVDGLEVLTLQPTTNDQVTAQSVSAWRHGFIVTAMSYNAAEGKDVAPLTDVPPISLEQLTAVAGSEIWFS
jgi:hypothetical protein